MKHLTFRKQTDLEKKIRRRISKGSKTGRYGVGRRRSRARPGRKKGSNCNKCGNTLAKDIIGGTCKNCSEVVVTGIRTEAKMHIPGMSKK